MAYERTIWKNREVERPRTFQKIENPDGTITLVPEEGNIIEPGTPIIAENMNKIEQGVEDAHNEIDEHKMLIATQEKAGHIKLSDIPVTKVNNKTGNVVLDANDVGAIPNTYGNIVTITTSTTLGSSHINKVIDCNNSSAITITVTNTPPVGSQITFIRRGAGTVTFTPASGVTLNSKDNKRSIAGQHASATLIKVANNIWQLIGALE